MNAMQPRYIRTLHSVVPATKPLPSIQYQPSRHSLHVLPTCFTPMIKSHSTTLRSKIRLQVSTSGYGRIGLSNSGDSLMTPNPFSRQFHQGRWQ